MKDLHVALPDETARKVERLAHELNQSRAAVIRLAVERLFASEEERRLAEEMRRYASEMADRSGEFVTETSRVVSDKLLKETRW